MKTSRINRRDLLKAAGAGATLALGAWARGSLASSGAGPSGTMAASGLAAPKLEIVRVGIIGVGARGFSHLSQLLLLEGVEITAVCDTYRPRVDAALAKCVSKGRTPPAAYGDGDADYKRMLERDDVDIVIIATPWSWHVPMAVDAMRAGKHAFVEVPAATSIDGCWELVEAAETTQRHCMMMENVCYGREELMVLNMCRLGVFGELLHAEAAYLHDLRFQMKDIMVGTGSWRTYEYANRNGNLYPTHGLGPVAQCLNINRGDRMDFLCSISSPARARELYAKANFPAGHERRALKFKAGDINTSIVQTALGRSILIQWDEQLPRPYSRLNFVQGTRGAWGGFPNRIAVEPGGEISGTLSTATWTDGASLNAWFDKYDHPLVRLLVNNPANLNGHGGMDFFMLWRIIFCLRNGVALDQDVYDAASWSVVGPLSEMSVANRGRSMDFPDFTRGGWATREPLGIVHRENLPPLTIQKVESGVAVRSKGLAGGNYRVERAVSAQGPWTVISSQTVPPEGVIDYMDHFGEAGSTFYRVSAD